MAVNLSPVWGAGAQLFDNSGNVLSGGKIYTYAAGTTTPAVTYTSDTGLTANSNPIILNSAGRVPYEIWLTVGSQYKFVLKDSNDTLIGTWDNIDGINSGFVAYTSQQEIQTATADQTVFTLTTMEYIPGENNLSVFVDGINQYGPGAQYAFVETDSTTVTFTAGLHEDALVKFTTAAMTSTNVVRAAGSDGQIQYNNDGLLGGLSSGTSGYVLTSQGAGLAPTWTAAAAGTVTGVTGTAPIASSGGTTPAISISKATTSTDGYLSSTDWNTFNNKGSGTVTSVTGTSPIASSGGATPAISIAQATTSTSGYVSSTDWNTFNGKQAALVSGTNIKTINSSSILGSGDLTVTASAAGSTGQLQYNNAGALGAVAAGTSGQVLTSQGAGLAPTWTAVSGTGTVTSVDVSGGTTGLTTSGGPVTTAGTVTLAGTLAVANGGTGQTSYTNGQLLIGNSTGNTLSKATLTAGSGVTITNGAGSITIAATGGGTGDVVGPASATDNAIARFDTTTGKLIQNSPVTIDDAGNIISPDSVQFSGTPPLTQPIGTLWFDSTTDTLNLQQNAITQQIGEEIYVYGKASAAISGQTVLQAIYKTGVVGASGNITFAPTVSGITDGGSIIGVGTEDIASGSFGRITNFGIVHGVNTNGSTYGETWVDGQDIWYNPTTGGLTKTKPTAPNIKVQIGTVINAGSGGSGSFQVLLNAGSSLGGTDDNVQFTTLTSGNTMIYDAVAGYWKNADLTAGTGVSVTNGAGSITLANTGVTSLAAGTGISVSGSTGSVTVTNSGVTAYPGSGIAVSTGSAWGTSKTAPSGDIVGTTDTQVLTNKTISGADNTVKQNESMSIAASDETTAITVGTGKVTFRAPYAMTLYQIPRASLTTASSSGNPTVDIKVGGTSIFSTLLSIDATETTSTTAATAAVLSTTSIADDAQITIDVTVAGTAAAGLKVTLYYRRT